MGWDVLTMVFKVLIALPVILLLIYISAKVGGSKLQRFQDGRYIKILERVPISKDNAFLAIKIGDKAYVVSSTTGKIEIVKQINQEELSAIESSKSVNLNMNLSGYKKIFNKIKGKKEDGDE